MDDFYKVARYAQGEMGEEEAVAFEQELAQSEVLREELRLYKNTQSVLSSWSSNESNAKYESVKANLANIGDQYKKGMDEKKPAPTVKLPFLRWAAVAASILLMFGAGYWFLKPESSTSNLIAFNNAYKKASYEWRRDGSVTMGSAEDQILSFATNLYNDMEYSKALEQLAKFSENPTDKSQELAIDCHIELGNIEEAKTNIDNIRRRGNTQLADWKLVGVLLKESKEKEAIELLEKLSKTKSEIGNYAKKMLVK